MKPPSANQIHLWSVASVSPSAQQQGILSAAEQAHFERIRAPRIKQQYWQARWAVRQALSHYVPEVSPQDWQFSRNAYGRPALQSPSLMLPLDFNISHTRGALVMAFVAQGAVGIDVEYTQRQCRALAVAQRYFSSVEIAELRSLAPELQRARFFDLWTLKEAYIKACGMGLAIPLGSFSFNFAAPEIRIAFDARREDKPERWRFWRMPLSQNHQIALALGSAVAPQGIVLEGVRLQADGRLTSLALDGMNGLETV